MIINGGSRSNGGYFAKHLMRDDQNDRVSVVEIRGLTADNVRDAFREMHAVASGTRCTNYFYHANINTRDSELLTPEQWQLAADQLEGELGLTDQPRFVVEHEKEGRTHRHIIWSRIDIDSMTAISDSLTYPKHERVARELERLFAHEPVDSVLEKDRPTERPERNPKDWESLRGADSQLDPKAIKAHVTELWRSADSGAAFAAALEDNGYILVRGDRRDFCIIDAAGDEHSLGRRLSGVKAAEIRDRLSDIDRDTLPTVAEGRALARERLDSEGEPDEAPVAVPEPEAEPGDSFAAVHQETVDKALQGQPALAVEPDEQMVDFDAVHRMTIAQAQADVAAAAAEEEAKPGSRFDRISAWWGNMRERFGEWRAELVERFDHYRSVWSHDPDPPAPSQEGPEP